MNFLKICAFIRIYNKYQVAFQVAISLSGPLLTANLGVTLILHFLQQYCKLCYMSACNDHSNNLEKLFQFIDTQ